MDLATILGMGGGFGLIILAIITQDESLLTFKDTGSVMIVIGGSFAALMVSMPLAKIIPIVNVLKKAVFSAPADPKKLIKDLVGYAEIARRVIRGELK